MSSLDYVLTLAIVLPLLAFILWIGPKTIILVYEMTCLMVCWPFL